MTNNISFAKPALGTVLAAIVRGESITRATQDAILKGIFLQGDVVDLGARDATSTYYRFIDISRARMTYCDIESTNPAVIKVDLEAPLPFQDHQFDTVLLMHVLEHIYNTKSLLAEMRRISRGDAVIAVPFLIAFHPDPRDYFRFTHMALERLLSEAGFAAVKIVPWGHGLFTASLYLSERFFKPRIIVALLYCITRGLDWLAAKIFSRRLAHQGDLGYICVARCSKDKA